MPQIRGYAFENSRKEKTVNDFNAVRTFKATIVAPSVNFGYNLVNTPTLKFYVAPGIGSLLLLNSKQEYKWATPAGTEAKEESNEEKQKMNLNIHSGLSIKNRFIFWSNFGLPTTTTTHYNYKGKHTSIQLGAGIKL
jgi:hypothetical protein